jgi:tRNA (cytosine38-C5)-methyltransferase
VRACATLRPAIKTHFTIQGNIEKVSVAELTKYGADVWLMAPPCQPYTRQGLQKHSADGRARSFLRLLQMLKQLPSQPRYLLLENVVGFETSDTHNGMLELLAESGYNVQEFILTPSQYAIPYSRPR